MAKKTSPETTVALLAQDIGYIKESVGKIEGTLSNMEKDFVRRSEFETYKVEQSKNSQDTKLSISSQAAAISTNDIAIATLKTQIRIWAIAGGVILATAQSVITAVLIQYFTH